MNQVADRSQRRPLLVPVLCAFGPFVLAPLASAAGGFTTFAIPGAAQTKAIGINSAGDVTGYFVAA